MSLDEISIRNTQILQLSVLVQNIHVQSALSLSKVKEGSSVSLDPALQLVYTFLLKCINTEMYIMYYVYIIYYVYTQKCINTEVVSEEGTRIPFLPFQGQLSSHWVSISSFSSLISP